VSYCAKGELLSKFEERYSGKIQPDCIFARRVKTGMGIKLRGRFFVSIVVHVDAAQELISQEVGLPFGTMR
jgi:hypothetical protein